MATYDLCGSGYVSTNSTAAPVNNGQVAIPGLYKNYPLMNIVDLSGAPVATGDVYQVLNVPANTLIHSVHVELIKKAVGTSLNIAIGDGGSTSGWIATIDAVGGAVGLYTHSAMGTGRPVANDGGYFYGNNATLPLKLGDTLDALMTATAITAGPIFAIFAECLDLNAIPNK